MTMHAVIDLETMGTAPTSAIVQIGARAFDPELGLQPRAGSGYPMYSNFLDVKVDLQSCIDAGLTVDGDTVMWWLRQPKTAQNRLLDGDPVPLNAALLRLKQWVDIHKVVHVWSHGANFDPPILDNAHRRLGLSAGWRYYNIRCSRTIIEASGMKREDIPSNPTPHDALADAEHTAGLVCTALAQIGMWREHPLITVQPTTSESPDA